MTDEMRQFQGTWLQTSWERDGIPSGPDELGVESRVTFTRDTFVVRLADGTVAIEGTFTLDPTQTPKTVDWHDTFGMDAGKTFLAIYELDGDDMRFCAADSGQARPTSFSTRPGQVLRVHRRQSR